MSNLLQFITYSFLIIQTICNFHNCVNIMLFVQCYNPELTEERWYISELTDSLIASQAFIFFLAGFETSSTTMTNALYELAQNHKIQDTLREEINHEYARNGDILTYDNIKKMDYLDKVFKGMFFREKDQRGDTYTTIIHTMCV